MKKLYIFRHGETDWNKEERIQCSTDIELNKKGLQQASENAILLKGKEIQYIYSSPLRRAHKTAEVLAELINVKIEIFENLRDMNGGIYEGALKNDCKKDFGKENFEMLLNTKNEGMELFFPGGETKREVRNRIVEAINDICKNTEYDTIGVVSHGFVLRELLRDLDFKDDSELKNCEIIEAEFDGNNLKIISRIKERNNICVL